MVDRIQLILKVNNLTASRFADEIGVQRSSISHILSGRNMPSLDLIQKILRRYPEIDSEWLLNGKGSMLKNPVPDLFSMPELAVEPVSGGPERGVNPVKNEQEEISLLVEKQVDKELFIPAKPAENPINPVVSAQVQENPQEIKLTSEGLKEEKKSAEPPQEKLKIPGGQIPVSFAANEPELKIEKIVIFYSNRTFREYFPE